MVRARPAEAAGIFNVGYLLLKAIRLSLKSKSLLKEIEHVIKAKENMTRERLCAIKQAKQNSRYEVKHSLQLSPPQAQAKVQQAWYLPYCTLRGFSTSIPFTLRDPAHATRIVVKKPPKTHPL